MTFKKKYMMVFENGQNAKQAKPLIRFLISSLKFQTIFKNKKIPTCIRNNNTGLTGHSEKGIKQSAQQSFNP